MRQSVQRTGVNTEAKLLLLTHAFEVMGCNVVQIRTDWFNQRSRRRRSSGSAPSATACCAIIR